MAVNFQNFTVIQISANVLHSKIEATLPFFFLYVCLCSCVWSQKFSVSLYYYPFSMCQVSSLMWIWYMHINILKLISNVLDLKNGYLNTKKKNLVPWNKKVTLTGFNCIKLTNLHQRGDSDSKSLLQSYHRTLVPMNIAGFLGIKTGQMLNFLFHDTNFIISAILFQCQVLFSFLKLSMLISSLGH